MSAAETPSEPRPRRILITTDCVGGVWNYTVQLARSLGSQGGYQVLIAATGPPPSDFQGQEARSLPDVHFAHAGYRLEWMEGGCEDLELCQKWLLNLESSFRPDVIHSNSYALAAAAFAAPVLVVAHSCVYSWWRAVHGVAPPPEWSTYRTAVAVGLRSACAVVAPTRSMLHSLTSNYDAPLSYSDVIHNGASMPNDAIPPKQSVILAAGRVWDKSKNLSLLDDVAAHIPWPLHIAGAVQSPEGRRAFIPRNAQLMGQLSQNELHQSMTEAAVFAHPALYEPFGLAVLEAAQRGCALVLSDIPSLRELWDDGALFCSPRDPSAWAAALTSVLHNDNLRSDLASRARSRASRFTTDRMVDQYHDLYRTMMTNHKRIAQWEWAS